MHCNIEFLFKIINCVFYMKQVLPIFLSPGGGPLFFYDSIEVDVRLLPKLNASFIEECCLRPKFNQKFYHYFCSIFHPLLVF